MKLISSMALAATMILATSCSDSSTKVAKTNVLKYFPQNQCAIIRINPAQILQDPTFAAKMLANNSDVTKQFAQFGLLPSDVSEVVLVMDAKSINTGKKDSGCMVITTSKDLDIKKLASGSDTPLVEGTEAGKVFYSNDLMGLTQIDTRTVMLGAIDEVKICMNHMAKGGNGLDCNAAMMRIYNSVSDKGAIAIAADMSQITAGSPNMPKSSSIRGWINPTSKKVDGEIEIKTLSAAEATKSATQMNQMISMMGAMLTKGAINGENVKVVTEAETVKISLNLDEATITKLGELLPKNQPPKF